MSIVLPPWYFNNITTSITGTPSTIQPTGASVTPGNSNADGSEAGVLSALAHDVHFLQIHILGINASADINNALLDILIDPAGGTSWTNFIDDLICGSTTAQTLNNIGNGSLYYSFPIYIKAGTSIGVRVRFADTTAINSGVVSMQVFGDPSQPEMWWCGQKVESLGINAASSAGTTIAGGGSGTYGSWTTVGTSSHPYGFVQLGINGADNNITARGYYWQIGYGSNKLPGSPTMFHNATGSETSNVAGVNMPIWCDVPSGTTWQARYTSSGTAPDSFNVALYGVY